MQDDLLLPVGEIPERNVGTHAHLTGYVLHQRPHQRLPRSDRPLVDREGVVGDQSGFVHGAHHARSVASSARAAAVERQILRADHVHDRAADRTPDLLFRREIERGRNVVTVRAAVPGQAGEHEAQGIEQFRHGSERAPDPGDAGSLTEREGGGNIPHVVHIGPRRLRHSSAGVGGEGFQIPPGSFRVEHAQREGGLPGSRHPRDPDDFVERDIHIDVFQVVNGGPAYLDMVGQIVFLLHFAFLSIQSVARTAAICLPGVFSEMPRSRGPRRGSLPGTPAPTAGARRSGPPAAGSVRLR